MRPGGTCPPPPVLDADYRTRTTCRDKRPRSIGLSIRAADSSVNAQGGIELTRANAPLSALRGAAGADVRRPPERVPIKATGCSRPRLPRRSNAPL